MPYTMPNSRSTLVLHYTLQRFSAFVLCLQLAITFACAHPGEKDYFPLSVGSRWEYNGRLSSPKGRFDVLATIRVEGETIIRGRRYFKYVITSDMSALPKSPSHTEEIRYYRMAHDGIYFLRSKDIEGDEMLEMPLPIPLGVGWLSGTSEVRAESVGTVRTNNREYTNCLKVTYKGANNGQRVENYLAPSVGLVRAVFADVVGPGSSLELTLVKYER